MKYFRKPFRNLLLKGNLVVVHMNGEFLSSFLKESGRSQSLFFKKKSIMVVGKKNLNT